MQPGLDLFARLNAAVDRRRGALGGVLAGTGIGFYVLPSVIRFDSARRLASLVGLDLEYWGVLGLLTALGAAVGLVVGLVYDAIRQRRAPSPGPSSAPAGYDPQKAMSVNLPELFIALGDVRRVELGGLRFTLSQGSTVRRASVDSSSSPSTQTLAYYEAPDATFPRFSLQPLGPMLKVAGAMGLPSVRFPDQPEFTQRYFVLAREPLGTQALLDPRVRAWLLAHAGVHLESGGSGLLVYRGGRLTGPGELEAFAREAAELLRLLDQAWRAWQKSPTKASSVDELHAFAAQMPASVARSMDKQINARVVTPENVGAFLRQTPPRKIPANISYQYRTPRGLAGMGVFFIAMASGLWLVTRGDWRGIAFGALFFLIGAPMFFFGGRTWWRRRSLLRNGGLAAATIETVESAGWMDDSGEAFDVSVRYQAGGQSREGRCTVFGRLGHRAKSLAAEGKMAPILYDPAHLERVIIADTLVFPPAD